MKIKQIQKMERPEAKLQEAGINKLTIQGWFCKPTHGSIFQAGFPDVFVTHSRYGMRWIEFKIEKHYRFTAAQLEEFPKFAANGTGIWICTDIAQLPGLLFKPQNWYYYLKEMKA